MRMTQEIKELMRERFGRDSLIALATVEDGLPWVRTVNAYYEDGAFYVLVNAYTNKMRQIAQEPRVAVSGDWFTGHGVAEDLGWVLDPGHAALFGRVREAFAGWYHNGHMDENDPASRLLRVRMTDGVLFSHGTRYDIDFSRERGVEGLEIVRLSPEVLEDYLYFFEHVAHTDYPEWDRCYCLDYCAADNAEEARTLFRDADTRREYAIRYVREGVMQGYLAYLDGQVVGWCNCNDRDRCRVCAGYREMIPERAEDGLRVKSLFCFTVAPAMRGRHIATALMERAIADAREEGYQAMEGYPDVQARDAYYNFPGPLAFYQRFGFEEVGEALLGRRIVRKRL